MRLKDNETRYIVQASDIDYLKKMTESSDGTLGTEEDEDDLLKDDIESWDVFDDYHKFQQRQEKIKERKKQIAQEERMAIQLQKTQEIEMAQTKSLERELSELEAKIRV
jgi:hypothetical protein